jgi:hypothetical protein
MEVGFFSGIANPTGEPKRVTEILDLRSPRWLTEFSMQLIEATPHGHKHLEDAIRLLESHPDFARVQVQMRDRLEEADRNAAAETRAYGSRARLEYVRLRFDIRAGAFLELVSDIHMQNGYMAVLPNFVCGAWEEHTGGPPEVMRPASDQAEGDFCSIHTRMAGWVKAGYQRLANPYQEQTSSRGDTAPELPADAGMNAAVENTGLERRAEVDAYIAEVLRKTGRQITRADIWRMAGYKSRAAFERWERNDVKRPSQRAHRLFNQILTEKPHLKIK